MPALNRVQLIGYLGKDPESRFTPSGRKVTHFSLGVTRRWKSGNESKEATDWVNVEAWERLSDVCQQYLKKGSLVYLEGRLKTDKYEVNGETRYFTKVVTRLVQFLSGNRAGDDLIEQDNTADEEDVEPAEAPTV